MTKVTFVRAVGRNQADAFGFAKDKLPAEGDEASVSDAQLKKLDEAGLIEISAPAKKPDVQGK